MATGENVGQHPANSPDGTHVQRHRYVARQMEHTDGRVKPTQSGATERTDSGLIPYPLVGRLEALETRALLARIEGLEARVAGPLGPADSARAAEAFSSELRIADPVPNRSNDDAWQLRLQVSGLAMQISRVEERMNRVRRGGRRRRSSRWWFWPLGRR